MHASVRGAFLEFNEPLEGRVPWMYVDQKGLVTVAVGNLLPDAASAQGLPFVHESDGRPATAQEIAGAWNLVASRTDLAGVGGKDARFAKLTDLRLTEDAMGRLFYVKLDEVAGQLRATFPAFEEWPADAQMGLLSLAWARGAGSWSTKFPRFTAACNATPPDFETAAVEGHLREDNAWIARRNQAQHTLFQNAARSVRQGQDPATLFYPAALMNEVVVEGGGG